MGVVSNWIKAVATSGKRVATIAWLETPQTEPAETGGRVLVHGQRVLLAPTNAPVAPLGVLVQSTLTAVLPDDPTLLRAGIIFVNESDTLMVIGFATSGIQLTPTIIGVRLESGEKWYFAPPRMYTGPVSAIHGATGDKLLVVQPW